MDFSFLKKSSGKILILGDIDTGKTYLSFYLLRKALTLRKEVGLLCSDLGQSAVGPPGCVSFKKFRRQDRVNYPEDLIPADIIEFVGELSPAGVIASHLVATKIVLEKALISTPLVIINTTGYVVSPEAQALKVLKIRLINPDIIIAIQENNELEPIIKNFECGKTKIYKLKKSKKVKKRNKKERACFRLTLFRAYFKEAGIITIKNKSFCLKKNMVVGLLDSDLSTQALGVIVETKKVLKILAPQMRREVKFIKLSSIFISPQDLSDLDQKKGVK